MATAFRYAGLMIEVHLSPRGDYWCDIRPKGSKVRRERITIKSISINRAMRMAAEEYLRKHPELKKEENG